MKHSESLASISGALVAAQSEMPTVAKTSVNPHFRSKYADLASVVEAARPVLAKHGLAWLQAPGPMVDGCMSLTTRIIHASGEWIEETATIPLSKQDAQGYGSACTYGRRYAAGMLGIVTDEDDDGNGASKPPITMPQSKPAPMPSPPAPPSGYDPRPRPIGDGPAGRYDDPVPPKSAAPRDAFDGVKVTKHYPKGGGKPHGFVFSDGNKASTFSDSIAANVLAYMATDMPCRPIFERVGKYLNVVGVESAE